MFLRPEDGISGNYWVTNCGDSGRMRADKSVPVHRTFLIEKARKKTVTEL